MSKISTYEVTPVPKLADKLIGTSVGGEIEDITYNFTLSELLNLFIPNIPANTLQGVLDYGNEATQDIILNGTIFTTYLEVSDTATILDSYLTGETHITGGLYDRLNSKGTAGQVLRSTGTQVEWYSIPNVIPTLQQVLASGNTADINIILSSNIQAVTATANNVVTNTSLSVNGTLKDKDASTGTTGQILSSTGTKVQWIDLPIYAATSPLHIDTITKTISIQKAGSTQDGYLSSADWITFSGKQDAISLTTTGSSGPATLVGTTINVPNYTLAGLGGVPQTRTLTINGVTYNLAAYRTWTIAAGVSSVTATSPLFSTGGVNPDISIQQAGSSLDGYLSSADWLMFNAKQPAGNYITSLTGEATGAGPGATAVTLSNSAVIGKLLTGLNITGGTVVATDSILTAFGKVQNQINSLVGGVIYKGVWNASTNTPTLTSSVGTQGNYYIVNVAGNTNLNGITDWNVGDWAIFNGSTWNKVDNTDSVTSVNGQTGAVSLTTDNIPEGTTNLYFLNSRARAALSFAAGSGAYNSTTGVITIPTDNSQILNGANYITLSSLSASSPLSYNNLTGAFAIQVANSTQNGYLSSTDWNTFNSKQAFLNGTGLVKSVAGTISYITDNSTNWNTAYDNMIVSAAVTGTSTKTLTLTQQDAGTITASWTDNGLTSVGVSMPSAFSVSNSPLTSNGTIAVTGAGSALQYIDGTGALQTFPTIANESATLVTEVYNETGATLTKGTVVYINGGHGNLPTVTKALATSDATSAQTYGVVQVDITNMNNGHVVVIGSLGDLDTQAYPNGTILYLSSTTAGAWTSVKQYAPAHLVYVGIVVRSHPTQGVVEIKIQNGYELDELHNVSAQTPSNGNILQYVSSTQLWTAVAGTTTNIAEGTNLYYLDSRARAALSFTPGSGAYNSTTGVITIPTNTNQLTNGAAFITLGSLSATAPLSYNNLTGVFSISQASSTTNGYLSSTDWNTFNSKQEVISLTTTGSSGPSTLVGTTLNVPNYTLSGLGGVPSSRTLNINGTSYDLSADRSWSVGTVTSVAALTLGTTGTDLSSSVATGTTTPVITLNVPTASAANRGALSSADWSTFNSKVGSVTATSPLASSGGTTPNITIQQSSGSQAGYLSAADWTTFNNKQASGNYITSLTGEATASGPGAASVTLNNSAVTGKVLTGINITGGTVVDTDSILTAFGKVQNQINGLVGGSIYKGTWNASTNTPTLTSGVGTRGWYYIVSVAGTTNLDGITDWFVGDWAIFDGTAWQQVDNTDAVVSVNGQTGAVSLTTDNIPEGTTNQYFLNSRARAALSFAAGSGAYNSTTGVITIPTNTNQLTNGASFITLASLNGTAPIVYSNTTGAISITQAGTSSNGYLSSTDWNTFNNKQNALTNPVTGTGTANYLPKFTGASTIGNSIAYDGGSSIGINTNAPYDNTQFKLDVNGGFIVKNASGVAAQFTMINANPASGGNNGFFIQTVGGTTTAAWAQIQTYYGTSIAAGALRLQPSGGQVLIGTTTPSSSFMLDVNGSFRTASNMFSDGGTILLKQGVGSSSATGYLSLSGSTGTGTGVIVIGLGGGTTSSMSYPTSNNYSYLFPSASGTIALTSDLSGYVTGSGTTNYIPKFTSSSAIGNSAINDDGTTVTITSRNVITSNYIGSTLGSGGIYFSGNPSPDIAYVGYNYTNVSGTEAVYQASRSSWRQHFGNGSTNQWKVAYRAGAAAADAFTDYITLSSVGDTTFRGGVEINASVSAAVGLKVKNDILVYNTISFTDASYTVSGFIQGTSNELRLYTNNNVLALTLTSAQKAIFPNDATINGVTAGKGAGSLSHSTAFGVNASVANTTGNYLTSIGKNANTANTTGQENTAIGAFVLSSNTTGNYNTAVGSGSLAGVNGGSQNTAIGLNAGTLITTGDKNTIVGAFSGSSISTGTGNTIIGANLSGFAAALSDNIIIGSNNAIRMQVSDVGRFGFNYTPVSTRSYLFKGVASTSLNFEIVESAFVHSIYLTPNYSSNNFISSNYFSGGAYLPLALSGRENISDLVLNTSGNVVIGSTTDGGGKFEVRTSTYNRISTYFSGSYTSGFKFSDLYGGIQYDASIDTLELFSNYSAGKLILKTNSAQRQLIYSTGDFDYGGYNVMASANATYRQAFYGALAIMWRNAEDFYLDSNHTYSSTNTNVATYASANGIGRMGIAGGDFSWSTYNGTVAAGSAYTLTERFNIAPSGAARFSSSVSTSGNVGINCTPSFVTSTDALTINISSGGYTQLRLTDRSITSSWSSMFYNASTGEFRLTQQDGGVGLTFYTGPTASIRMQISASGLITSYSNITIDKGSPTLRLAGSAYGNSGARVQFEGWASGSGYSNWQIDTAFTGNNQLNFVPSTTAGGSTFTTPVFQIDATGTGAFGNYVTANELMQVSSGSSAIFRARGGGYGGSYNTTLRSIPGAIGVLQLGNNGDNYIIGGNSVAGGYLIFKVNATAESISSGIEAMRITSSGRITLNNYTDDGSNTLQVNGGIITNYTIASVSSANVDLFVFSAQAATYTHSCFVGNTAQAASTSAYFFYGQVSNTTATIKITTNGNIVNTNGSYGTISDIKIKRNIVDTTPKLENLLKIRVVNYNLIDKYEQHKQLGVIAQEVEKIFPNMVEDSIDKDTRESIKSVKYSVFIPMLIKAMQEQQQQINDLKSKIK